MTSFCLHYFRQPDKTKVIYIIQTDLKGRIPIKLIESALPTMQLSFFSSVRKAIKDGMLDKWTSVSISVSHPYTYICHSSHVTVTWLHNSFCIPTLYHDSNLHHSQQYLLYYTCTVHIFIRDFFHLEALNFDKRWNSCLRDRCHSSAPLRSSVVPSRLCPASIPPALHHKTTHCNSQVVWEWVLIMGK